MMDTKIHWEKESIKKKVVGNLGQCSIKKGTYTCSYFYYIPGLKIDNTLIVAHYYSNYAKYCSILMEQ